MDSAEPVCNADDAGAKSKTEDTPAATATVASSKAAPRKLSPAETS